MDRFWAALPSALRVLTHGDLCTEITLWHKGHVVALLDFEYAMLAPVELDLDELVKSVYAPPERPDVRPDPDGSGRARLRQVVNEIAGAVAATPGGADRLLGYALLLDLWGTEDELSIWRRSRETWMNWAPYRALKMLAEGNGGYLAPVLARLGGV
jgi:scyllo-inosamine 4-kinase